MTAASQIQCLVPQSLMIHIPIFIIHDLVSLNLWDTELYW